MIFSDEDGYDLDSWERQTTTDEPRLSELVEAKVAAAQNGRASRSNGRRRAAAVGSRTKAKRRASNGSATNRRKAA